MNLAITIIAVLMVADASFALLNLSKVESLLHTAFPKMSVKKLALIEGLVGAVIIIIKVVTHTVR